MVVTDDCKGFVVVTFAALVADVVPVDEAAVVVPLCELVDVLGFDVVAAYLAVYLFLGAALNPLGGIETHVDVVLQVLPVLQEVLTELAHLTDQLQSFQLSALRCRLSFVYGLTQFLR